MPSRIVSLLKRPSSGFELLGFVGQRFVKKTANVSTGKGFEFALLAVFVRRGNGTTKPEGDFFSSKNVVHMVTSGNVSDWTVQICAKGQLGVKSVGGDLLAPGARVPPDLAPNRGAGSQDRPGTGANIPKRRESGMILADLQPHFVAVRSPPRYLSTYAAVRGPFAPDNGELIPDNTQGNGNVSGAGLG